MNEKVFGIGFHKTGTSSLAVALSQLGYRVTGPNWVYHGNIARTYLKRARAASHKYDAFQDNPWPLVYREMDEMWPDAKFILTYRDTDRWYQSQVGHFGTDVTPMRKMIYGRNRGRPEGNEQHYKATYDAHNAEVRAYFKDRPGKLLEINFSEGPRWDPLCDFLGRPVPETDFPHANAAGSDRSLSLKTKVGQLMRRYLLV